MWGAASFYGGNESVAGYSNAGMDNSAAEKKGSDSKNLTNVIPLVVRQIRDHPEEDFRLFNTPVKIAHLVGILRSLNIQSANATCQIEDHTGSINGIIWLAVDEDTGRTQLQDVKEDCYIEVFGSIRNHNGEKIIMILKISPIDDCNVITRHLLQMIHTRLKAEHAVGQKSTNISNAIKNNPGQALATSMMSYVDDNTYGKTSNNLTSIQQKIYDILQKIDTCSGLHFNGIMTHFKQNETRDVKNALDFLLNEGHIYTTIDTDHFKVTGSL